MVLKVVTGKILETLELAWFPGICDRFRGPAPGTGIPHERHFLSACCQVSAARKPLSGLRVFSNKKNSRYRAKSRKQTAGNFSAC